MKLIDKRLFYECILPFAVLPLLIAVFKPKSLIYPVLWIMFLFVGKWLSEHHYNLKEDWNKKAINKTLLKEIFIRFVPLSVVLLIFTLIAIPERVFSLPLQRPEIWVMVLIFYPILSVLPQEFIFRSFFFRRYAKIFPNPKVMILASSLAFGWVHIFLMNWVAVVFSFFGGLIFSATYLKTRSLAAVTFEHAIYGCMIFTLGLGYYFFHGSVR